MIDVLELRERGREWLLREDVVEKDYVLGWLLWGIASEPALTNTWVFKGGTCLKKCYFETYRFSEDLDFTLLEGAPDDPEALRATFAGIAERIYEASGIEMPREQIRFEAYKTPRGGRAVEGRVYYRGPRRPGGDLPRVKIDLTPDEVLVYDPIHRAVTHPFSDGFPATAEPLCYSLPEIFGEKLRALAERCLPRDLYDVVSVFRRPEARGAAEIVLDVLKEKCRYKEIAVPTLASIEASPRHEELESEWQNMLGHQLPALPPIDLYRAGLRELFDLLEGRPASVPVLPRAPVRADEIEWTPPATIGTWGTLVPLEAIRFAGANRLCVDLGYQGSVRRVEPYSLRQTRDGHLLFFAVRRDTRVDRSYRVDRLESVRITKEGFTPVYPVEFWPTASISAPPLVRRQASSVLHPPAARAGRSRRSARVLGGQKYVVQCSYCGKHFLRRDTNLAKHKMKGRQYECSGRVGYIVRPAR
jgi:predicted nucleotidyltransferase component of viral defense system